jgi:hypothetical protein
MNKLTGLLVLLMVAGLLMVGCQNEPNPVAMDPHLASDLTNFDQASVVSATLHIYVIRVTDQPVDVHRITDSWEEMVVTWNNFGGAFAPGVEGTFLADAFDWRTVDVTALVQGWLAGDFPNYGLLLDQVDEIYPRTGYYSREGTYAPFLEICYTGGACDTIVAVADTYIWEVYPDMNDGAFTRLYTGWERATTLEKQTLIQFELPEPPELAALGDFVWFDDNVNGIQDAGEVGVPGVTVNLYDCFGALLATTTTDASGYYLFSDLEPGDYNVEFILPEGYAFSPQDQGGDDAVDSDADPATGIAACTNLEGGETDLTWDAGIYRPTQEGCTLTIGFWKTHAGFGPQDDVVTPLLPIWLGDAGGTKSIAVINATIAHDILLMNVYGHQDNGITKLYAQLLGAKLNIASGASGSAVSNTISRADEFLADNDWTDWDSLSGSMQSRILRWQTKLDEYNNGLVGPGHCDY